MNLGMSKRRTKPPPVGKTNGTRDLGSVPDMRRMAPAFALAGVVLVPNTEGVTLAGVARHVMACRHRTLCDCRSIRDCRRVRCIRCIR